MAKVLYTSAKDTILTEDNLTVETAARVTMEDGELEVSLVMLNIFVNIGDKKSVNITKQIQADATALSLIIDQLDTIYTDLVTYGSGSGENVFNGGVLGDYLAA